VETVGACHRQRGGVQGGQQVGEDLFWALWRLGIQPKRVIQPNKTTASADTGSRRHQLHRQTIGLA
jgi:hypothetical protein